MTSRLKLALIGASLCLALSACSDGGSDPAPPEPVVTKLNADNMLDAAGVAMLAHQRVHGEAALLLASVFTNYIQQLPAGVYACSAGGSLTLTRPSALVWTYTAQDCDNGTLLIRGGQLVIDAGQPDGQGLKLQFNDTIFRTTALASTGMQVVNGTLTFLINVPEDLGKRSTASLRFTINGRVDAYTDVFIANKRSDDRFAQYGISLASPRFAHPLKLLFEQPANVLTVEASDGSTVKLIDQASGALLEVRRTAAEAPLASRTVSDAELESARNRALQ